MSFILKPIFVKNLNTLVCMYAPLSLRQVSVKRNINKFLCVFNYSHARKQPSIKTNINHTIHKLIP
jgi:hypothetical protein